MANGKKPPFLRTAHNYDMNEAGDESSLICLDPTLTQQHFRDECDINTIVERFHLTGEVPQVNQLPSQGDFTGVFDYQSAMNAIVHGRELFDELPAKLRARFDNNPAKFLDFCDDPDNAQEAVKLGILKAPEPQPLENEGKPPVPPQPVTK